MITIHVGCSFCGNHITDFHIQKIQELTIKSVRHRLEVRSAIVRINGDNLDVYCSKECAE